MLCAPASPSDTSFRTASTAAPTPPLPPPNYTWPVPRGAHHLKDGGALEKRRKSVLDSDEPHAILWRGVGDALWHLLEATPPHCGRPPALVDEHQLPLCDHDSPLVSVPWTVVEAPRKCDARSFVFDLLDRLEMTPRCAVTAVVLLETLVRQQPRVLCGRSARPLVLATCVLALKFTYDAEVLTNAVFAPLEDLLTGIGPFECALMEEQVLRWLDWRVPNDPRVYELYARELVRVGLRGGQTFDPAAVPPMFDA